MGCFIIGVFPGQNLWDKRTKVRNFTRSFDLESKASEEQGSRHFVTALARGLAVIQAFDHTRPRMTLAQVAQVVNLPRAAARRSLLTLMDLGYVARSEEHTSELQSLMRISYAVFCLKKKKKKYNNEEV